MKRVAVTMLAVLMLVSGCGKQGDSESSDTQSNNSEQKIENEVTLEYEVDTEELENAGYKKILDFACCKITDGDSKPVVDVVFLKNEPELSVYLVSKIMEDMNYECDFSLNVDGKEYVINDNIPQDEEDIYSYFPDEWHDTLEKIQTYGGIDNFVSKSAADAIDRDVDIISKDYFSEKNKLNQEIESERKPGIEVNTEGTEDNADKGTVICESKSLVDNENFIATLYEKNGEYDISVLGLAENEEKATIMLASCNEKLAKLYDEKFCKSYSVCVYCNNKLAMVTVSDYVEIASGFNTDGSAVSGKLPDWIVSDITMPENEYNAYNDEILMALSDFAGEMQTSLK